MIKFFNALTFLQRKLQKLFNAKTVGVRVLVFNEQGQVLLIRHTYTAGWHFPGGGVNARETPKQAALREAYEEAGIKTQDEPTLMGFYYQTVRGADDYVALYLIHSFIQYVVSSPEIAEIRWSDPDQLPEGTSESTYQRLREYFDSAPMSDRW